MISMLLLTAACDNDFESEFGLSPDERTAIVLNDWKETLVSSEHGWLTHYYPNPEMLGGFSYVFKFQDDENVLMNWGIRDDLNESPYSLKMFEKPLLVFDTYSNFSKMTDPQNGEPGKGFGGELEFVFVNKSINGDTIFLEERVGKDPMILVKATSQTWEDIKQYPTMTELLERRNENVVPFYLNLSVEGWDNKVNMVYNADMQKTRLTYSENGVSKMVEMPVNFTHQGFEFHHALEFNGVKVRSFKYDEALNQFQILDHGVNGSFSYENTSPSAIHGAFDKYFSNGNFGTWSTYISPKIQEQFSDLSAEAGLSGFTYSSYHKGFDDRSIKVSFENGDDFEIKISNYEKTSENTLVMHFGKYDVQSWSDFTQEEVDEIMESEKGQLLYNILFGSKGWTIIPVFTPEYGATMYLVSNEDPEMYIYFGD